MSVVTGDDIIPLDRGYQRVYDEGIKPFIEFIEASEREFFKAKDFVTLYDLIFKMCFAPDTRLLTNQGFMFREQIEKELAAGAPLLFACYEPATERLVYSSGRLVIPDGPADTLIHFTAHDEAARWDANSDVYGALSAGSSALSISVTAAHDMFVQTGFRHPRRRISRTKTSRRGRHNDSGTGFCVDETDEVPFAKMSASSLLSTCKCPASSPLACVCTPDETYVRMIGSAAGGVYRDDAAVTQLNTDLLQPLHLSAGDDWNVFFEIFGFWWANGFVLSNGNIAFTHLRAKDIEFLRKALGSVGLSRSEWIENSTEKTETHIIVTAERWRSLLKNYGRSEMSCDECDENINSNGEDDVETTTMSDKNVTSRTLLPPWIRLLDKQQTRHLIDGVRRADGEWKNGRGIIHTSDVHLRDELIVACYEAGYSAVFGLMCAKGALRGYRQLQTNEIVSAKTYAALSPTEQTSYTEMHAAADYWAIQYSLKNKDIRPVMYGKDVVEQPYNGPVWCVTVDHPDHLVIAQRAAQTVAENGDCIVTKASRPIVIGQCIQRDPYNWSEAMYEKYTLAIRDYLLNKVKPALAAAKAQSFDVTFLREWKTRWNNQKLIVAGLSKLFMYLDRFYTPNTDGICALKEQGFKLYKEDIFDVFVATARQSLLNAIEKERFGESADRHLMSESTNVFVEMGYNYGNKKLTVYITDLERYVIEHAGAYYSRHSREWLDQDSCPVYLEKCERVLAAERARVEAYLNRSTIEPLHKECYQKLLKEHQRELLRKKTGLFHLLSINATDDLSRLYRLYKGNDSEMETIADLFFEHVKKAGIEIVDKARPSAGLQAAAAASAPKEGDAEMRDTDAAGGDEKDEKEGDGGASVGADANHALVRNLIQLHAQYNDVVTLCFDKAQLMQKALKKAFEDFINKDNRVSKLLAKFVHDVLKKGSKVNVKDVESTLDNVVFLYGYIQEKDVFERDYQLFLASRLLMGLCESEHSEKSMIAKLKTECGYIWTNKLEGMFKDVQLSKDLMQDFRKQYEATAIGGGVLTTSGSTGNIARDSDIALEVNVCTTGYWPSTKVIPCNMPKDLQPACDKYRRFYLNKHTGHKLEWRFDQGQAELIVDFSPQSRKGLVVSTYQMMILLVFNTTKQVSFKELVEMTGIPRYEIANHLLSLCHPKVNILLKKPMNKKLEDTNLFRLNAAYKNPLKKVTVPLLRTVDAEESGEEENKAIELQRRHQMDAAVVRIMKTRKTLRHNLLVAEVIQQLSARFKPKPNDIKKRIEALIEQEYMERDTNERGVYNYLA